MPLVLLFIILLWLLAGSGRGGRAGSVPRVKSPKAPELPAPVDPHLFRPVMAETDDSFLPASPVGTGVEAPGALCLLCGQPKAHGDHAH